MADSRSESRSSSVRTPINPLEGLKLEQRANSCRQNAVRTPINPLEGLKQPAPRIDIAIHNSVRTPINPLEGLKLFFFRIGNLHIKCENTDQPA